MQYIFQENFPVKQIFIFFSLKCSGFQPNTEIFQKWSSMDLPKKKKKQQKKKKKPPTNTFFNAYIFKHLNQN